MSKLQDALDLHDEWMTGVSWNPNDPHSQAILVIVEAARKYANGTPTYLVYTRQDDVGYLGHIYQGLEASRMSANPNLPGKWFTALGVTEDE